MQRLIASEWEVKTCLLKDAREFIRLYHYAGGSSNTAVYVHGLYRKGEDTLFGVVWWLPPTRVACESVNKAKWQKVLSLSRMAILPGCPKNACSFLLARSIALIKRDGRFVSLVTYADESQGHTGLVYKAANWTYIGRVGPTPRWVNADGIQVACKATKNRTNAEMERLGHRMVGRFHKHKFVLHLEKRQWPESL